MTSQERSLTWFASNSSHLIAFRTVGGFLTHQVWLRTRFITQNRDCSAVQGWSNLSVCLGIGAIGNESERFLNLLTWKVKTMSANLRRDWIQRREDDNARARTDAVSSKTLVLSQTLWKKRFWSTFHDVALHSDDVEATNFDPKRLQSYRCEPPVRRLAQKKAKRRRLHYWTNLN